MLELFDDYLREADMNEAAAAATLTRVHKPTVKAAD
jgi:hypothetical protein